MLTRTDLVVSSINFMKHSYKKGNQSQMSWASPELNKSKTRILTISFIKLNYDMFKFYQYLLFVNVILCPYLC